MKIAQTLKSVFLASAMLLLAYGVHARGIPIDGYAATVNNQVITVGEVLAFVQPVRMQLETTYEGKELKEKLQEAYESALESLIERALIIEEFKAAGGQLPDRLIDDQISIFIKGQFKGDRAAFLEALAEERMTLDEWREQTRERLYVTIMRRKEVTDKVVISPAQIRDVYEANIDKYRIPEQVHMRMLVLHRGDTHEDQTVKREEAEQIRDKLLDGEDFIELTKENSEGIKASQGGDFGWIEPESLRPELATVAHTLDVGRISEIIETEDEIYIIKIEGRKSESITPFDEVSGEIEKELRDEAEERLYVNWIKRLREKYYVKIYSQISTP